MPTFIDKQGQVFDRLTIIRRGPNTKDNHVTWICQCTCGNIVTVSGANLTSGSIKSCGCLRKECVGPTKEASIKGGQTTKKLLTTHNNSTTRLYYIWKAMRQRCTNPNNKYYKDYGGRGITVAAIWDDFINFKTWALSVGYDQYAAFGECTLDRIDNDKGYEPNNCRWVTLNIQANNRRKKGVSHDF